jgi:hypothetical protein
MEPVSLLQNISEGNPAREDDQSPKKSDPSPFSNTVPIISPTFCSKNNLASTNLTPKVLFSHSLKNPFIEKTHRNTNRVRQAEHFTNPRKGQAGCCD